MCGIVGYVGKRSAQDVLLDGLEKLEYRGYDSAGVALALDGGKDGLKFYRALISRWAVYMPKGCEMVLEAGYDTYSGVENLFYKAGFKKVATRRDYNNIVRLVSAIKD